jgi:tetratricopeptide (TPR) repeat protein
VRSNSRRRRLYETLVALLLVLSAGAAIGVLQPVLNARFHELRVTSDVYALPPPEQVVVASLGYRAALADVVYAHVLVAYGLHFQEKRRFEFVGEYLDTVNALDPTFRQPYRFADTLLVMSPVAPRLQDYEKAREILERGIKNLPFDSELWLTAGQYLAYLARPHLPDEKMQNAWKLRGAEILSRACELASNNENIPYQCVTAARLFDVAGEREAAIESLRRILTVNDDPEIERLAYGYLSKYLSERERETQERRKKAFNDAWKHDLPFVSKDMVLILGPRVDTARCAGAESSDEAGCETSWVAWARNLDRRPDAR